MSTYRNKHENLTIQKIFINVWWCRCYKRLRKGRSHGESIMSRTLLHMEGGYGTRSLHSARNCSKIPTTWVYLQDKSGYWQHSWMSLIHAAAHTDSTAVHQLSQLWKEHQKEAETFLETMKTKGFPLPTSCIQLSFPLLQFLSSPPSKTVDLYHTPLSHQHSRSNASFINSSFSSSNITFQNLSYHNKCYHAKPSMLLYIIPNQICQVYKGSVHGSETIFM